ncbi:hypothetical protein CWT12_12385 [Actinomyces sp. 432]|uniref:hypothetical protein n=1 Tax=Actinomyces sp. 432 TaxID=2057798 RepID=UPI001373FA15|nr:hypothetical protein [Actinomyces sp. 432]QHO91949.1 hypothetical protein CWT12_12385 [Actinomyces sp. 432]
MSHPLDAALRPLTLPPPRGPIPHGLADITALVGQVADGLTARERSGAIRSPRTPVALAHRRWLLDCLAYRCVLWAADEGVTDPVQAIRDAYDRASRTLDVLAPWADTERLGVLVDALGQVARLTEGRAGALIALAMHATTWATTITTPEEAS